MEKSLGTLLDNTEHEILLDKLTLYGGCLGIRDITSILSHLTSSAEILFSHPETQTIIKEFVRHNDLQPVEALKMAYSDAVDMLETALQRNEALYLLRDAQKTSFLQGYTDNAVQCQEKERSPSK